MADIGLAELGQFVDGVQLAQVFFHLVALGFFDSLKALIVSGQVESVHWVLHRILIILEHLDAALVTLTALFFFLLMLALLDFPARQRVFALKFLLLRVYRCSASSKNQLRGDFRSQIKEIKSLFRRARPLLEFGGISLFGNMGQLLMLKLLALPQISLHISCLRHADLEL
jgi:hypothetical protein